MKEETVLDNEELTEGQVFMDEDAEDNDTRVYEVGFLLDATIPEDTLAVEVQKIKESIEKDGARFISEEFPKLLELEYTMTVSQDGSKSVHDTAYFGWVKYEKDPSQIESMHKALSANTSIVRFITIKTDEQDFTPFKVPTKVDTEKDKGERDSKKESSKEPIAITKEELDKTIEELVIE